MKKHVFIAIALVSYSLVHAQEASEKIKEISKKACECISKIDINEEKKIKSKEIKFCISAASTGYQLKESLSKMVSKTQDTLNKIEDVSKIDSLVIGKEDINVIDSDENYKEVEAYLYDNCSVLNDVYFTDNTEHDNSFSDRKKALRFYEIGQIAFQRQNYKKAISNYKKAVKADRKFAFAWDNLGYSYRKTGDYKKAINCYNKSLSLDPKGKMPLMNIAVAYQLNNDIKNAKKAYETYKGYYANDPEGFYGLGRIYYIEKDYEAALDNMIKAYYLYKEMNSPYNIDAQKHISFMYKELKDANKLDLFNRVAKKHKLNVNIQE